jgi:hypothetical protein
MIRTTRANHPDAFLFHFKGGTWMSHIVTVATEIRDVSALRAACRRLGLGEPIRETVQLFSGEATGHCVRLPDWQYPVVCNVESDQLAYDNFEGRWGEQCELDRLMQAYAVEKAKIESRRAGHSVTEQPLSDGSIKLTINVGGAA